MLSAAIVLARKDIKSFIRDRGALMLSLLVPIALVTVFGWIMAYAFGGNGGMPKVTLHVVDEDASPTSQQFIKRLQGLEMLKVELREQSVLLDSSKGDERNSGYAKIVADGDAHHLLVLQENFESIVQSGASPPFAMFRDPGREMEGQMIQLAMVQACVSEYGGQVMVNSMDRLLEEQGMETEQIELIHSWMTDIGNTISDFVDEAQVAEESSGQKVTEVQANDAQANSEKIGGDNEDSDGITPAVLQEILSKIVPMESTDVSPPNRSRQVTYQQAQSVAGMSVMMLLFALTSCGSVLLKEREDGTLKRLFAQPIERNSILLGKFLFVFAVGAAQLAILFTYGEWMFRVGLFRDPVTLVVLSLTWVATGGAFGLFLAAVSRSSKQAEGLASLLILMMAALGGCWFPLQLMDLPMVLEAVCKSTMTYWAMTGFQGMLWNQLAWYEPKMLVALGWQWGWLTTLSALSIFFFKRNYCRG